MTKIEWTEKTWNPIVGCSIVSKGCTNCYAMRQATRLLDKPGSHYEGTTKSVKGGPVWTGKVARAQEHILLEPLRRKKPTMFFVNSMGDLFHEDVPDEWIDRVFAIMALTPQHTYQVLTKRSARMREYFINARSHIVGMAALEIAIGWLAENPKSDVGTGVILTGDIEHLKMWPLPNVWLGVSTEDQASADERIPDLLATPAAVRFISAEPLLGQIDLMDTIPNPLIYNAVHGMARLLDWVIVGGESGKGARPMHPDWARRLRDQCAAANVPFFFKQWGEWASLIDRNQDDPDGRRDYTTSTRRCILNLAGGCGFHGERVHLMQRYSKNVTGRLLDGREHSAMPERRS